MKTMKPDRIQIFLVILLPFVEGTLQRDRIQVFVWAAAEGSAEAELLASLARRGTVPLEELPVQRPVDPARDFGPEARWCAAVVAMPGDLQGVIDAVTKR